MSDAIAVRGIRAHGRHGALPGERDHAQPLDVDVELEVDLAAARQSDALGDTLDYAQVANRVRRLVAEHSFALLERLGDEIARELKRDPRVRAVSVTLAKPGLLDGATPSVTVRC